MGKIIVLKAKKGIFLTELKEPPWVVLWVGKKGEWFSRALSILVVANSKVLCSWTLTSDISRKNLSFHTSFFFSLSLLPTLFFLTRPLSLSGLHSFIYSKYLALTLCKAHTLSAIGYSKMKSLDMEAGRGEADKYIKSSKWAKGPTGQKMDAEYGTFSL